jgi:hypothetical protein
MVSVASVHDVPSGLDKASRDGSVNLINTTSSLKGNQAVELAVELYRNKEIIWYNKVITIYLIGLGLPIFLDTAYLVVRRISLQNTDITRIECL